MIALLSRGGPADATRAEAALRAVPYPTPDLQVRVLGHCVLGIATRPEFVDEHLSADGPLMAVLTGRIDNAAELRQELLAGGVASATERDVDVVVAAFRRFGGDAVRRFRGSFAAVVTDGNQLWAFRDHIGFRPLFFRDEPGALIVAGESRQVVVLAGIREEPNLHVLEVIFHGGAPSNTLAALAGVSRLPQAMVLRAERGGGKPTFERYWDPWPLLETGPMSEVDARERFLELLDQACRRSLTGRDAILLSGGLDSPMVAAFAAPEHLRRTGRPLGGVTAVFPDLPSVDEHPYTQLVATRFGMPLHAYRPVSRTLDDVEEWSHRFGSPIPVLSIPEVSEAYTLARQHGYQNVLSGEWAEMTFGKWPHMLSHLLSHGRFRALYTVIMAEHGRGASRRDLIADALTAFVPGRVANWHFRKGAPPPASQRPDWLLEPEDQGPPMPRPDYLPSPRERWRILQMAGTTGSTLAIEADAICATIAGVTIRRPLADIDLWEFFLRLPAEIKFPVLEWKALARRALPGVIPDEILARKKTVFNAHVMQQVDYPTMERYLSSPTHRIPYVDYGRLNERIARREIGFLDWIWARELTRVHAFLSRW